MTALNFAVIIYYRIAFFLSLNKNNMAAFLIKSTSKAADDMILKLVKTINASVKMLDEEDEMDVLLIQSIEKGMKSGKASKESVRKFFNKHGIRIH